MSSNSIQEYLILTMAAGADGPYDLDPVRVMKGGFLISQLGLADWKAGFNFKPYDYGPFDPQIYRTLESLTRKGFIIETVSSYSKYPTYSITQKGKARVTDLGRGSGPATKWLKGIGRYVTAKSFEKLLKEIYSEFPAYAEKSVLKPS